MPQTNSFIWAGECAVTYEADSEGTITNFSAVNETVCCLRETGKIKKDWKRNIEEYMKKRNRK